MAYRVAMGCLSHWSRRFPSSWRSCHRASWTSNWPTPRVTVASAWRGCWNGCGSDADKTRLIHILYVWLEVRTNGYNDYGCVSTMIHESVIYLHCISCVHVMNACPLILHAQSQECWRTVDQLVVGVLDDVGWVVGSLQALCLSPGPSKAFQLGLRPSR